MNGSAVEIPAGLIDHVQQHNRRALFLSLACLLGSAASWGAVYGLILWAELLVVTSIRGVDAADHLAIRNHFLIVAAGLILISLVVRQWEKRHERFHLARAIISLFSIPVRLTTGIWKNFLAQIYPSQEEYAGAWNVLDVLRTNKKIATTNLPVFLTTQQVARRIVYLLSITNLIDTDLYGGVYFHHFRNEQAENLVRRWSRSLQALEN